MLLETAPTSSATTTAAGDPRLAAIGELLQAHTGGNVLLHPDGRVVHFGAAAAPLLGVDPQASVQKAFFELLPPAAIAQAATALHQARSGVTEPAFAVDVQSALGRPVRLAVQMIPVVENGTVLAISASITEIAPRFAINSALRNELATAMEQAAASTLLAFVLDGRGQCTSIDPRWATATGRPLEAAAGTGWLLAMADADRQQFRAAAAAAHGARQGWRSVVALQRPDGSTVQADIAATPIAGPDGLTVAYFGLVAVAVAGSPVAPPVPAAPVAAPPQSVLPVTPPVLVPTAAPQAASFTPAAAPAASMPQMPQMSTAPQTVSPQFAPQVPAQQTLPEVQVPPQQTAPQQLAPQPMAPVPTAPQMSTAPQTVSPQFAPQVPAQQFAPQQMAPQQVLPELQVPVAPIPAVPADPFAVRADIVAQEPMRAAPKLALPEREGAEWNTVLKDGYTDPSLLMERIKSDEAAETEVTTEQPGVDKTTGLANKLLFAQHVAATVGRMSADALTVSVSFIDLHGLDVQRSVVGARVTNDYLFLLAKRLEATIRSIEIAGRIDGNILGVLSINWLFADDLPIVARRLMHKLGEPLAGREGAEISVGMNLGMAVASQGEDVNVLFRRAWDALQRSKGIGPNEFDIDLG